jgi:hypothetical protein
LLSPSTASGTTFSRSTARTPAKKRGRDSDEEQEEILQMKSIDGSAHQVNSSVAARVSSLPGGAPLPPSERAFFEPRFGVNLESVRLHTGGPASELACSVHARAFTVRDQIVFGSGEYRPAMSEGRRLLAHELTHTMQQGAVGDSGGTVEPMIQRLCHSTNRTSGSPEQIQIQQYLRRNATVESEYYVRNPAGGGCYYPDVVDTQTKSLWEVKPWTEAAAAAAQMALYVPAAQAECLGGTGWHAGTAAELNVLFTAVLPAYFRPAGGTRWLIPGSDPSDFIEVSCPAAGTVLFRSAPLEGLPGDILGQIGIGGGAGAAGASGSNRRRRVLANLPAPDLARVMRLFSPGAGGGASMSTRMAGIAVATLQAGVSAAGVLTGANTPFAAPADVTAGLPAGIAAAPPHTAVALRGALGAAAPEKKAAILADALWPAGLGGAAAGVGLAAFTAVAPALNAAARRQLYTDVLLTLPPRNLSTAITAMIGAGLVIGGGVPAAGAAVGAPAAGSLGSALPGIPVATALDRLPTGTLRNLPPAGRAAVAATAAAGAAPPTPAIQTGLPAVSEFVGYIRTGAEIARLADLVISDISGAALPAYAGAGPVGPFGVMAGNAAPAIGGAAGGAAATTARNRIIAMWTFALRA